MRTLRTIVLLILIPLAFAAGVFSDRGLRPNTVAPAEHKTAGQAADLQQALIEELQANYYKAVDVEQLSKAGVKGMLKSLKDPYTVYMSPHETEMLNQETQGSYSGIGAALDKRGKQLTITQVFKGSPALEAGLKSGDVIVTVDGTTTSDVTVESSIKLIKGEAGTTVRLEILRAGKGKLRQYSLTRRQIQIPETRTRMLHAGAVKVGYIQLFSFADGVGKDVRKDVDALESQGAQWIVFDLRYNGGGLLNEGINVASDFLTGGVVVSTEGLHSPKQIFDASGNPATTLPMVILVNQYSASASEIVTGALADHQRATIIGSRTFGKGLVQTIEQLPGGASFKLTTAVYLTPNGTDINKKGIKPDVVVKDDLKTRRDEQLAAALRFISSRP